MEKDYRYLTEDEILNAPEWATHYQFNKDRIIWESEDYYYTTGFNGKKVKQKSQLTKCRLISAKEPEVLTIDNCIAYLFKNKDELSIGQAWNILKIIMKKLDL